MQEQALAPGYDEDLAAVHADGFVDLARDAAYELLPRLSAGSRVFEFGCGDGTTTTLPHGCDAIIAVGEVLGYLLDPRVEDTTLDSLFGRCATALRPQGLLMFDLAGAGRVSESRQRSWVEGRGWTVLVESESDGDHLSRRIVSFRDSGDGGFRRSEELHQLKLHEPTDVLMHLRRAGFRASRLRDGYDGRERLDGLDVYVAQKR